MNGTTVSHCCTPQQRPRGQAGVLAAVTAGVAVLAAACGSGGSSPAGSSPSHPPGYQQYHAYSQCMRSHGAPFWPEPSEVPQGVWDNPNTYKITPQILAAEHGPGWQAALTACQHLAPRQLPYTAAQINALRSHLQRLAACMRTHGITHFPSRSPGPTGPVSPAPAQASTPAPASSSPRSGPAGFMPPDHDERRHSGK